VTVNIIYGSIFEDAILNADAIEMYINSPNIYIYIFVRHILETYFC